MAEAQAPEAPKNATQEKYTLKTKAHDARYEMSGQRLAFYGSVIPALLRGATGAYVLPGVDKWKRPTKPIEVYDIQASPYCRKVREATTLLDVDVLFYPCPKNGTVWRPKAQEVSPDKKQQFPLMHDPNSGKTLQESDEIVKYLFNEYGDGKVPLLLRLGPLTTLSTISGQLIGRGFSGAKVRPNTQPKEPLEIWGYEASPFCLQVREVLTELEVPHIYHSCARNSPKRPGFEAKWGVGQYPYIEDPNTKVHTHFTSCVVLTFQEDRQ